jgi:ribonuclease HII
MHAVGHASAHEIDEIGIIAALRLAACRALAELPVRPDCALLDGSHNWLSLPTSARELAPPQTEGLFELPPEAVRSLPVSGVPAGVDLRPEVVPARVVTQVKADMRCAAVAAASVLAKVERDAIMVDLAGRFPQYGWEFNKGYSAPEHIGALRRHGPSIMHRQSWNLPGAGRPQDEELDLTGLDDTVAGLDETVAGLDDTVVTIDLDDVFADDGLTDDVLAAPEVEASPR